MRCPVDHTPLNTAHSHNHLIEVCPSCSSVRFDGNELHNIVRHFGMGKLDLFEKWEKGFGEPAVKHHSREPVRTCPLDYREMDRQTFAGNSGIHIDHCAECGGFWFDGDDVARLIKYTEPDAEADMLAARIARDMHNEQKEREYIESFKRSGGMRFGLQPVALFSLVQTLLAYIVDEISREATR